MDNTTSLILGRFRRMARCVTMLVPPAAPFTVESSKVPVPVGFVTADAASDRAERGRIDTCSGASKPGQRRAPPTISLCHRPKSTTADRVRLYTLLYGNSLYIDIASSRLARERIQRIQRIHATQHYITYRLQPPSGASCMILASACTAHCTIRGESAAPGSGAFCRR